MQNIQDEIRTRAKQLLESGEIAAFIGWEAGRFEKSTTPLICLKPDDTSRLIFNEYCVNTLAKYVLDLKTRGKVGLCVRGCDSRGINRMIQDNQLIREQVYLLGISCCEMKDSKTDEVLDKCKYCTHKSAVVYDEFIGKAPQSSAVSGAGGASGNGSGASGSSGASSGNGANNGGGASGGVNSKETAQTEEQEMRFEQVEKVETMQREERQKFFDSAWQKCIRCYACRNVCPCCTCRSCFVDARKTNWLGKQADLNENRFFGLIRAFHISDRCIECGECERACPMDLPLMSLNKKLVKDMNELFGTYESGINCENKDCLNNYNLDDKEEFM